jgi:hypothetical protein
MAYQLILFNGNGTHFNIMVCLVLYLQLIIGTSFVYFRKQALAVANLNF